MFFFFLLKVVAFKKAVEIVQSKRTGLLITQPPKWQKKKQPETEQKGRISLLGFVALALAWQQDAVDVW